MVYRFATPDDTERIAALHARSWQETYRGIFSDEFLDNEVVAERLAVWQERFHENRPTRRVIVAEDDTNLAGFACVELDSDPTYGALLDNLHVAGFYKGRGVGRQLIKRAAEWVRQQSQTSSFYLWVYTKNYPAIAFYDQLGAINQETASDKQADAFRYVWPDTQRLIDACSR